MPAKTVFVLPSHRRVRTPAAAHYLNLSPASLIDNRFRRRHQIPFALVGGVLQFDLDELDQWLERQRQQSAQMETTRAKSASKRTA
jgi:hypothetical protein